MKYKVLCSDLDGTLLSTKSDVSDFTISEIHRIKKSLQVLLVSARMPKSMTYLQQRLGIQDQPIICYNGALIMHGNRELLSVDIPMNKIEKLYQITQKHFIQLGLYHKNEWYVEEDSERVQKEINYTKAVPIFRDTKTTLQDWKERQLGAHKIMLMGTAKSTDTVLAILENSLAHSLHFYRSNDTLIEVAPKTVSKLSAIQELLKNRVKLEDVIAFGDNYNDVDMLQHVGLGVAVGNARDRVKEVAQYVTLPNTENGVAHFIKKHLVI